MDAEKATFTITRMADLLEVSRSGYYKWRAVEAAGTTAAALRRAGLDAKVAAFHAASDQAYGSPRILADLREEGERVSRKTVAASMRRQGLQGISPRQFTPITTVSNASSAVPADLVNRKWDTGQRDRIWTSDITYLATGEGWLYLCGIRDGCSRRSSAGRWRNICVPIWLSRRWTRLSQSCCGLLRADLVIRVLLGCCVTGGCGVNSIRDERVT